MGNGSKAQNVGALPDWAPANPSPEFLRAASVLKSIYTKPQEGAATASAGMDERLYLVGPAVWELFGTLTDEQMAQLRRSKETRVQAKQMSDKQKAALNIFVDTWGEKCWCCLPQSET